MNLITKLGLPVIAALGLASPSNAQTVVERVKSYTPSVSFKPVLMPVTISVDAEGNVKSEITGTVSTPVGEFTFTGSEAKPRFSPGSDFAKFSEIMKRDNERMLRWAESGIQRSHDSMARADAILNPKPQEDLARKVAALEEENRQLRAKLLIYEAGQGSSLKTPWWDPSRTLDGSKTPTGSPVTKDDSTRTRPFPELLKPAEPKP